MRNYSQAQVAAILVGYTIICYLLYKYLGGGF